ncbi:flagellar basal body P-ring formation chaperone FlgA [Sulfurimonas sp.]|uniref:flagellar basal body P-ring formation chaperone FlgA n=1 Tax=Sulfurimonas sp. TaxID=2022749 RepID=UPI0025D259F7|nr:flagellar basal body P-ring formation chaperone FlgA [Sulfurimonas sp.]
MLNKFLFFILLSSVLYANNIIQSTYYIDNDDIYLSHIIKEPSNDQQIYKIELGKYTKRIRAKELIKVLKEYGYKDVSAKSRYVKFIKKSPIDTSSIEASIQNHYLDNYENIEIKEIVVEPRGYIKTLPNDYQIEIKNNNYLSSNGVLNIKTIDNKKIYFNYHIVANLWIYVTKKQIRKDTQLSVLNTIKKSIILDKFRAKPIEILDANTLQSKRHIKKNKILTSRDVEILNAVKKNSTVNVSLDSLNMSINFNAKALQDGKIGDIISVQKRDLKRLKVKVIGKNRVEIQ